MKMKALNTPSRSFFARRNKSALIVVVLLATLAFQTAESKVLNKQTGNAIDVSKDLVPLHIAQSNLPANDQNVDAGPLLAAAVGYATKNGVNIVNIPMGNYYFASAK